MGVFGWFWWVETVFEECRASASLIWDQTYRGNRVEKAVTLCIDE
jgi:hypothetical protein